MRGREGGGALWTWGSVEEVRGKRPAASVSSCGGEEEGEGIGKTRRR